MHRYKTLVLNYKNCYNETVLIRAKAMTDKEQRDNRRAIEHAIAQQALEGLAMTPEAMSDLQRVASGDMSFSSVIDNLYSRYAHVEVFKL
ncbi:MAG: antitoxin VbhA family protein [Alphaproteobacteria bacterium]